jgi:hypothetical protein
MPKVTEGATFRSLPKAPPSVRLDRIVSASSATVDGQVVSETQRPVANTQLLFVLADQPNTRESVTSDGSGKFRVSLESGTWLVYTRTADGNTEFRRKINVRADEPAELRLVSR